MFVKRRWRVSGDGALTEEASAFRSSKSGGRPNWPAVLEQDIEVWPRLEGTDVVVLGRVPEPEDGRICVVRVGPIEKRIVVRGPRLARRRRGRWAFERVGEGGTVDVGYANAYGGVDVHASRARILARQDVTRLLFDAAMGAHLVEYPRNPGGVGCLASDREDGGEVELPRLDDPDDPLTEERFAPTSPWWLRPIPVSFGYASPDGFPRSCLLGGTVEPEPPWDMELPELRLGRLPAGFRGVDVLSGEDVHPWGLSSASPGLSVVDPGPALDLLGFQAPDSRLRVPIPELRERVRVARAGVMARPVAPTRIASVRVNLDDSSLEVVYRGVFDLEDWAFPLPSWRDPESWEPMADLEVEVA